MNIYKYISSEWEEYLSSDLFNEGFISLVFK